MKDLSSPREGALLGCGGLDQACRHHKSYHFYVPMLPELALCICDQLAQCPTPIRYVIHMADHTSEMV